MTLLGEGGKGTRGTVDGGVTDGEDGDHDNDVHDRWEGIDLGIVDGDDERRSGGISAGATIEEKLIVVGDEQTDERERDDVEEGDTPENLLDGRRERLARVCGLSGSETDKFSTGEGEGRGHEDAAKTLEAVVERAGVGPVTAANVLTAGSATDIEDDTEDAVGNEIRNVLIEGENERGKLT